MSSGLRGLCNSGRKRFPGCTTVKGSGAGRGVQGGAMVGRDEE